MAAHPDVIVSYLKTLSRAVRLYRSDQQQALDALARELGVSADQARLQAEGLFWLTSEEQLDAKYFGAANVGAASAPGGLAAALKATADFLVAQKVIRAAPELADVSAAHRWTVPSAARRARAELGGGVAGPDVSPRPGRVAVPLLELRHVSLSYPTRAGDVQALGDISLTIDAGDFICIVGPSGCGKSTLLRIIAGFLEPTTGEALIEGRAIHGPGADRGVVFQQPALYPWLTVGDNVGSGRGCAASRRTRGRARVAELLRLVGLSEFKGRAPGSCPAACSSGRRSRAC